MINLIKLLILGAAGSMGRLVSKLALEDDEIDVVAACDINNIGHRLENLVGTEDPNKILITNIEDLQKVIDENKPDVALDFSIAKAAEVNCTICVRNKIRCIIGTTGLTQEFIDEFEKLIVEYGAPAVISSNMATGVNIFFKIASILTSYLENWDIEIIEAHHHRKVDAPSGTALTLGKIIGDTIGADFNKVAKYGRSLGPNKRLVGAKSEIGVHSIRAGDIVGDHTILYAGPGERIEFRHQAHSRMCFASGAILAIKYISEATENKIFSTREVLGL